MRHCGAHDTGNCAAGLFSSGCDGIGMVPCVTAPGEAGVCATTPGKAAYCRAAYRDDFCQTDLDCQTAVGGSLGRAASVRGAGAAGAASARKLPGRRCSGFGRPRPGLTVTG